MYVARREAPTRPPKEDCADAVANWPNPQLFAIQSEVDSSLQMGLVTMLKSVASQENGIDESVTSTNDPRDRTGYKY